MIRISIKELRSLLKGRSRKLVLGICLDSADSFTQVTFPVSKTEFFNVCQFRKITEAMAMVNETNIVISKLYSETITA